jgi:hypothetical protein
MSTDRREGQIIWRELLCPDVARARSFYGELCGWTFTEMQTGDGRGYVVALRDGVRVGGFRPVASAAVLAAWLPYVSVADVDATIARAVEHGGRAVMPAQSVPGVGRIGVIGDPTGGSLGLMRGEQAAEAAPERAPLGTFCWETLSTDDVEQARDFHAAVIGWTAGAMGSGVGMSAGEVQVANLATAPAGAPTHWASHVVVEKLEAAVEQAEQLGGMVLIDAMEIPGVGRICGVGDPFGAVISLFEAAPAEGAR